MKILSKKKYNKILDDCKELQKTVEELKRKYESVKEILETEKTSPQVNAGKKFCLSCEHSYRHVSYFMGQEVEECGCLLEVPCESFKRRKDN